MIITGIAHAQITIPVGCEAQARHFYCDLLGLPEIAKPESLVGRGGLWLKVGALQLHIGTEDGVDRWSTKAHIAYEVTMLSAWRQLLIDNAIAIEDQPPIPNYRRLLLRDPFGNRVELMERILTS